MNHMNKGSVSKAVTTHPRLYATGGIAAVGTGRYRRVLGASSGEELVTVWH